MVDHNWMLTENDHASGLCCMITAMTADCAPPIKFIHVVIDSGAGYLFIVNACIMYQIDHVMQLATVRIDPFVQFSCRLFLPMWIRGLLKFLITGPLQDVMIMTPAKENKVPRILANPLGFLISRCSSLRIIAITKVKDAMVLTIDARKVGEVYVKLAKYMLSVKPIPKRESTNISANKTSVSFGLTFLSST